jgi:hypothetical protein
MEWHIAVQWMLQSPDNQVTPVNWSLDFANRPMHRKRLRIKDGVLEYSYDWWAQLAYRRCKPLWVPCAKTERLRPVRGEKIPFFAPIGPLAESLDEPGKNEETLSLLGEVTAGLEPSERALAENIAFAVIQAIRGET